MRDLEEGRKWFEQYTKRIDEELSSLPQRV
jgi:hypothetical protein